MRFKSYLNWSSWTGTILASLFWVSPIFSSPYHGPQPWNSDEGEFRLRSEILSAQYGEQNLRNFNWAHQVEFGLFSQTSLSVGFGKSLFFGVHQEIIRFSDSLLQWSWGLRSIFSDPEASLYGESASRKENFHVYTSLGLQFHPNFSLFGGVAYFPVRSEDQDYWFWGLEKGWKTTSWIYQGQIRINRQSHRISLQFKPSTSWAFQIGISEFQRVFFREHEFGFHGFSSGNSKSPYGKPGLFTAFSMRIKFKEINENQIEKRIANLERKLIQFENADPTENSSNHNFPVNQHKSTTKPWNPDSLFSNMLIRMRSGASPDEIRTFQESFILNAAWSNYVSSVLASPKSNHESIELALRIAGFSPNPELIPYLIETLIHPNPILRREALIALEKSNDRSVIHHIRTMTGDKEDMVRLIALAILEKWSAN
jgi:hypothetical protein